MKKLLLIALFLFLLPSVTSAKVFTSEIELTSKEKIEAQTFVPDVSTYQYLDWGHQYTNIGKFWRAGFTGRNVRIAILDTGIDYKHPDLRVVKGASFVGGDYMDDNGHGTHVAGIIGARNNGFGVKGVAYDAQLYAVKVIGADGSGTLGDLNRGLRWAIDERVSIINMSLGLTADEIGTKEFKKLEALINEAWSKNIVIVAAAGNEAENHVQYPAAFKNVIAVSSVSQWLYDSTGRWGLHYADYTNFGKKIEVSAPGSFIYSTFAQSQETFFEVPGYEMLSGTSMATPYVVGYLADLKKKYPTYNNVRIRQRLMYEVRDIGARGRDMYYGYGMTYVK